MTQSINEQTVPSNPSNQWAEQWQHTVDASVQNWNNTLRGLLRTDGYSGLWNTYIKGLMEVQQVAQKVNQALLQAYGLPTRADNSQINRQLYEINNRLDELEARLNAQTETIPNAIPTIEIAHS